MERIARRHCKVKGRIHADCSACVSKRHELIVMLRYSPRRSFESVNGYQTLNIDGLPGLELLRMKSAVKVICHDPPPRWRDSFSELC